MQESNILTISHNALATYSELCKPVCKELKIPQTAFDILMFLADHPDYDTATEITHHFGIKKNLISMHVDKLVQGGYLTRESIPGNRRSVRLVVTDKAKPLIEKGHRASCYYHDYLIKGLSTEEIKIYRKCMSTMASNIEELADILKKEKETF